MTELAHHPLAQRFQDLGPADVLNVVEALGFQPTGRLLALNSYENRVYQVDVEEGPGVIAKFYRPGRWSVDALEDEHDFLYELADADVSVSCPLTLADGYSLGTLPVGDEGIHYALFEKVSGRVNDEPTEPELRRLGRQIAHLHRVGSQRDADARDELGVQIWGAPYVDAIRNSGLLPSHLEAAYLTSVSDLFELIDGALSDVPYHRIHGDCHHANLLWNGSDPTLLDFDDFLHGPAVQDIWMLAPSIDGTGRWRRQCLVDGYREVCAFDDEWFRLVEPLRSLRLIRYTGWITQRWHDPTFQRTFAHVLDESWWAEEVRTLRQQKERIEYGDSLDSHG